VSDTNFKLVDSSEAADDHGLACALWSRTNAFYLECGFLRVATST